VTEPTPPTDSRPVDDDPRARAWGAVLIVAAVLIGMVLLWKGFAEEGGIIETTSSGDEVTTTTAGDVPLPDSTTTTAAPTGSTSPPAEVSVLVANGSGATGVAGRNADRLEGSGYATVETTNAASTATSVVYFGSGAEGDAAAIADALGITAPVQAMPTPPPVELNGATVLVVIGTDKA
jgi:polyisoprenyl-teichoic acid--peptidoglycan teichoic acid transferase